MPDTRYTRSEGFEALVASVHRLISRSNSKTTHELIETSTTPHAPTKRARWTTPYQGRECSQTLSAIYDDSGLLQTLAVSNPDGTWCELVSENNPVAPSGVLGYWCNTDMARAIEAKIAHCFRWQRSRISRTTRSEKSRELALAA